MDKQYAEIVRARVAQARELDYVVVVDLEATCTDDPEEAKVFANDIIEIGWALLRRSDGQVVDKKQWYVRPTATTVNRFCTELTGITPQTVEDAPPLASVLPVVEAYHAAHACGPFPLWASFGEFDRNQVERQCAREGLPNPFSSMAHLNVKAAAQLHLGVNKGLGLQKALKKYGLVFEGRHHCGVDDAVNISRVLALALSPAAPR